MKLLWCSFNKENEKTNNDDEKTNVKELEFIESNHNVKVNLVDSLSKLNGCKTFIWNLGRHIDILRTFDLGRMTTIKQLKNSVRTNEKIILLNFLV